MDQIEWSPKILGQIAYNDRISQNALNQQVFRRGHKPRTINFSLP